MNIWKFYLTETAEEDLKRISYSDKKRILIKIKWLKENFEKKLLCHYAAYGKVFLNLELEFGA